MLEIYFKYSTKGPTHEISVCEAPPSYEISTFRGVKSYIFRNLLILEMPYFFHINGHFVAFKDFFELKKLTYDKYTYFPAY